MSKTGKSYCSRCDFETNHSIIYKHDVRSDNEDNDYAIHYKIVKCLGCESISFRKVFLDLESMYPNENGVWIPDKTITTYPKKLKVLHKLENFDMLPDKIRVVYKEAISAFNNECFLLTGVAFRSIIEAICIEENIPGRNLEKKINSLLRNKLITDRESKRLHSIRFIGNDSVHDMKVPKASSLTIVLNIIEHLLNNLYLIDYKSKLYLETVIDKFPEFTNLLECATKSFNTNDEVPLAKILGKNVRRLNGKISEFESELISKIKDNLYQRLDIGKIDIYGNSDTKVQHFIIK